jgi:hypothetical protein
MVAPGVGLYVPAEHGIGLVVSTGQYRPAGQGRQSATLLALGVERYVPVGQLVGVLDPTGQ